METGVKIVLKDGYRKEINKIKRKQARNEIDVSPILDEVIRDLDRAVDTFANTFINEMETILKDKTPVDNSATREAERQSRRNRKHLKDTIKKKIKKKGKYTVELFVGWDREYGKLANIVDGGASAHIITPSTKNYLAWPFDRDSASGEWFYLLGGVFHPGMEGKNMINIAQDQIILVLGDRFSQVINSVV